jgi:hypothetical protein
MMTGKRAWLGYDSPLDPVWLWHALFDGTRLCRCPHSTWIREIGRQRHG